MWDNILTCHVKHISAPSKNIKNSLMWTILKFDYFCKIYQKLEQWHNRKAGSQNRSLEIGVKRTWLFLKCQPSSFFLEICNVAVVYTIQNFLWRKFRYFMIFLAWKMVHIYYHLSLREGSPFSQKGGPIFCVWNSKHRGSQCKMISQNHDLVILNFDVYCT